MQINFYFLLLFCCFAVELDAYSCFFIPVGYGYYTHY